MSKGFENLCARKRNGTNVSRSALTFPAEQAYVVAQAHLIAQAYTVPINVASTYSGLSRSEIYRCLAEGKINAVKSGKRTLILMATLREHLATLPVAIFQPVHIRKNSAADTNV